MENYNELRDTYTLGIWTVKPGMETEFINEWTLFANWTSEHFTGAGHAYLLRDEKFPDRFISFGPWDQISTIQQWRDSNEFKSFGTRVKSLCVDFQPNTMKVVSTSKKGHPEEV
ncbi:MAG TPA: antibiotic biosynthesis monooxygenase [Prolixibacteraceae bacterium]|jgi:heme-degrading monooxygenase HmoA